MALFSPACGGKSIISSTDGISGSAGSSSIGAGGSAGSAGTPVAGGSSNSSGAPGVAGAGAVAGDCSTPACGGNIIGIWSVSSAPSCLVVGGQLDLSPLGIGCPTAAVKGYRKVKGSFSADVDGTYKDSTVTTGVDNFELEPACLSFSGVYVACDRLAPIFGGLGYTAVSCVADPGGGCACSAEVKQSGGLGVLSIDPSSAGTFSVRNDVFTLDGQQTYPYCSAGDVLTVKPRATNPPLTGSVQLVRVD